MTEEQIELTLKTLYTFVRYVNKELQPPHLVEMKQLIDWWDDSGTLTPLRADEPPLDVAAEAAWPAAAITAQLARLAEAAEPNTFNGFMVAFREWLKAPTTRTPHFVHQTATAQPTTKEHA